MTEPYGYEKIVSAAGVHYRVYDPQDNRIATCYVEANARLIVAALNQVHGMRRKKDDSQS